MIVAARMSICTYINTHVEYVRCIMRVCEQHIHVEVVDYT